MAVGKVLCLGDSLTAGDESNPNGFRSYRGALQRLFTNAGYTIDFVGTQSSTPASGGTDPNHDGYGGAYISDAGVGAPNASNNLSAKITAIRDAIGAVDIIILLAGWNDAYNQPTNIGTRYAALLDAIQAVGSPWASAKILMLTLSPEPNKSVAQTGSEIAAYATLNTAIRGAVTTTRQVADLAALTTDNDAERNAMVEKLLYDALTPPTVSQRQNGEGLPSPLGGHYITSWNSIRDFNANWRETPWRRGMNGGTAGLAGSTAVKGHPAFVNSVEALAPWFWIFAGQGHASSNTVVEVRNLFAQAWRGSTGQWEFFYEGARTGITDQNSGVWDPGKIGSTPAIRGFRDGITSYYRVSGGANVEVWAEDTSPSRGVSRYFGGANRSLMVDAVCFCVGAQARLALLDPAGNNDIAQSRFIVACGFDAWRSASPRYDYWGWPNEAMDGGHDRWQLLSSQEWTTIGSISIGRNTPSWQGPNATEHYEDPGTPPPHEQNYSTAYIYNEIGSTYSKSPAQVRANPPRLPQYWTSSVSGGSTAAWVPNDYWLNPSLNARDIHWSQQGADRAAKCAFDKLVALGWVSTFTDTGEGGGSVSFSLLPGIASVGTWAARYTTETTDPDTAAWVGGTAAQPGGAPSWQGGADPGAPPFTLPIGVVGEALTARVRASGNPAPTYSVVSGLPAWAALIAGGDVNKIRNPLAAGAVAGTPGTNPTNWSASGPTGVTKTIVGVGVEDGFAYVDVQFTGTPTAAGTIAVWFETATGVAAVAPDTWTASVYQRLVGGAMTNVGSPNIRIEGLTSGGAVAETTNGAAAAPTSAALSTQRLAATRTLNNSGGTTAYARPSWRAAVTVGQQIGGSAAGVTIRFGAPQIEKAAAATSFVQIGESYIRGTPTGSEAESSVTLRATNSAGSTDITTPLYVVQIPTLPAGVVGVPYTTRLLSALDVTWSYDQTMAPGLTLDGSTGVLTGLPATAGSFAPRFFATIGSSISLGSPRTIVVSGSGSAALVATIVEPGSLRAGADRVVVVLVTNGSGLPVPGASVTLTSGTPAAATVLDSPRTTDAAGQATFVLRGVAVGSSVLTANVNAGAATDTAVATITAAGAASTSEGSPWGRLLRGR